MSHSPEYGLELAGNLKQCHDSHTELHYGDCQPFEMCVGSLVCRRIRSRLMFCASVQVYSFGLGRDSTMAHIAWMSVGAFTTIHALPTEQTWEQF